MIKRDSLGVRDLDMSSLEVSLKRAFLFEEEVAESAREWAFTGVTPQVDP